MNAMPTQISSYTHLTFLFISHQHIHTGVLPVLVFSQVYAGILPVVQLNSSLSLCLDIPTGVLPGLVFSQAWCSPRCTLVFSQTYKNARTLEKFMSSCLYLRIFSLVFSQAWCSPRYTLVFSQSYKNSRPLETQT